MAADPARKAHALAMLERSAARSPTRNPNLAAVERGTGVERQTLRRWWHAADGGDPIVGAYADAAAEAPLSVTDTWSIEPFLDECAVALNIEDREDPRVRILAGIAADRARCGSSATARVQAAKLYADVWDKLRVAEPRNDGPMTPEDWIARMLEMPALLVEALVRSPVAQGLARARGVLGQEGA